MTDRPLSVVIGRDPETLDQLFAVKAPDAVDILDVTFNKGVMWKGCSRRPTVTSDTNPDVPATHVADCRDLHFATDGSFDVIVFDPPHLPNAVASAGSSGIEHAQYGLGGRAEWREGDTISSLFPEFLTEAKRVLRPGGLIFAKLSDFVHNHKYQWVHVDFIQAVQESGMTPCDVVVKVDPCAGNLKSSKWQKVHHFRRGHCYWIVVRNGGCEAKRR